LTEEIQAATHNSVEVAFAEQGYTDDDPKNHVKETGIELMVFELPETKKVFMLLPFSCCKISSKPLRISFESS
jgi:hypothetical protein